MAVRMQQRRATALQWLEADPILEPGEIGFETDTVAFKIGDGINTWSLLDYFETSTALQGTIDDYVPLTQKGAPLGVATLDANGFVPASQLDIDVTADINAAISALVDSAPDALNTLNEIAEALNNDEDFYTTITNLINGKANSVHTHLLTDVTDIDATAEEVNLIMGATSNIQTQLDGKAATSHTHVIDDVTNLQTTLDGKAASVHTHVIADVTSLQTELDSKKNETSEAVSSNITAVAGYRYLVDTTAVRTITLPATPSIGDEVQILDASGTAGTNNITVENNSEKINGVLDTALLDVNGVAAVFIYTGSTYGWRMG